ncbi:MAG: glycosyltransferase family 4 protein, partial [Caldilineaceae bacterium]|nr:glycosyltransferase family 4 protein [Caldilineaceae bacterium]
GVQPILYRLGRPDYLLCVSEFIRRLHIEAGYPERQSKATYLGIPLHKFPPHEHTFPAQRTWRLLFVGQLWEGKGAQVAIEAVKLLRKTDPAADVELNIFGSGAADFERYLGELVKGNGLEDLVRLRGFVSHEQLRAEFHGHDIYLFCSCWDEPFSGGLLEALATGIPTIATTAGGTPEAVTDGVNGLLVPPNDPQALADAIVRLMHNPPLYQQIGARGALDVQEHWSFDSFIDRVEAAYLAVVDGARSGRIVELEPRAEPLP